MGKMMLQFGDYAAEVEREKARERTHDAMLPKARSRQVTGGQVRARQPRSSRLDQRRIDFAKPTYPLVALTR